MVHVSVLSLDSQMVFLCLRHAGAVYHILYLRAGNATPRHAFIKEPLASVVLNRAFDNTVCLLSRQVLAASCEFTVCFLLPSFFFFSFPLSLPPSHLPILWVKEFVQQLCVGSGKCIEAEACWEM